MEIGKKMNVKCLQQSFVDCKQQVLAWCNVAASLWRYVDLSGTGVLQGVQYTCPIINIHSVDHRIPYWLLEEKRRTRGKDNSQKIAATKSAIQRTTIAAGVIGGKGHSPPSLHQPYLFFFVLYVCLVSMSCIESLQIYWAILENDSR